MTKPVPIIPVKTSEAVSRSVRDYYAAKMHDALTGFAVTNAVFAFVESKLWDDLKAEGSIDAAASAAKHGYHQDQVLGLLRFLATQDIFKERERFFPTPYADAVFSRPSVGRNWLYRGGYGNLMFNAKGLMDGSLTYGRDLSRQGKYVAIGSCAATSSFFDEVPLSLMEKMNAPTIVDLGCGAAEFLISFVKRSPKHRGIGIDIDPQGIEEAKANVARHGVADRVDLVVGNAFDAGVLAKHCQKADLFYAYAMEHELLRDGEAAVLTHLDRMAEAFPGKRFLLGEPLVNRTREDGAFYWLHVLSKQGIPLNVPGWTTLLQKLTKADLEAVYRPDHEIVAAYFSLLFHA